MNVQLRPGTIADSAAICSLLQVVTPIFIADPAAPEVAPFLETFKESAVRERLCAENFQHWIAESQDTFCGYMSIRDGSHLYHLFIDPRWHGHGIGRQLWTHMLNTCGSGPFTVNSTLNAVGVYTHFGFTPTDEPQTHQHPPFVPMRYSGDS